MKKQESFLRKDAQKEQAKGVQYQTTRSKPHPTQGLWDAVPKAAGATQPSDRKSADGLSDAHGTVHGRFVAGQCLLPLTLFTTAPGRPLALMGGIK